MVRSFTDPGAARPSAARLPKFRVSEMNYDWHGGYRDTQVWDKLPDGTWKSEAGGAVKVLKFTS